MVVVGVVKQARLRSDDERATPTGETKATKKRRAKHLVLIFLCRESYYFASKNRNVRTFPLVKIDR